MTRRFVYIVNPSAGTRSKHWLRRKIEAFAHALGVPFHIFASSASGNYTFLKAHIAAHAVTDVVIAGGDGTINAVLGQLYALPVQFGLLPCGSGNGLAFSSGLSKNIDAALAVVARGRSAPTDAFLVNGRFGCMLCGVGFDAQVAHAFAAAPERGLNTYIKKSVQHFFSARAYPFKLHFADTTLSIEAFFISIANSNQFGNNVTIAPQASLTDGLLDVVIVTRQNKLAALWQTLRQVGGFNKAQEVRLVDAHAAVIYLQTPALQIKNPGWAPMHLDGDPVDAAEEINVQLLKGCFRLIYP